MNKFCLWAFYIATFGIGYFYLKHKAKNKAKQVNDQLTVTDKLLIDLDQFINCLGGIDNVIDSEATINSIKIHLKNIKDVDCNKIKELGAKGTMISDGYLTCLFGDFAKILSVELNKKIVK